MDKRELDECLVRISNGDRDALGELYESTKKGVFAFLYPYYSDKGLTEDAMHDVYIKIGDNISKYTRGSDARAWILQIAKNAALNAIKKRGREIPASDETLCRISGRDPGIPQGGVFEAINLSLDGTEREIVFLRVLWGYKHREIAKMMGMPLGTCTSKYKKSLEKIRKYMEDAENED